MSGLNQYDYSVRFYHLAGIRFPTPDPHSENYYSWSPYVYVGNNPMKYIDPTGMDWYKNEDGTAYMWRKGNDATYTQTIGEGDNAMTMTMTNIGETYVDNLSDGTQIVWNQNSIGGISEPQSLNQGTPSVMESLSSSENFVTSFAYNTANDISITLQGVANLLTLGAVSRTNEFTGAKSSFTNLDGSLNNDATNSLVNIIGMYFAPATKGVGIGVPAKGLWHINKLNAAQFSKTFKGNLSTLSAQIRGKINVTLNQGINFINGSMQSGTPIKAGANLMKPDKKNK